jgi:multicomponent Na+:H+ antiporter subunit E
LFEIWARSSPGVASAYASADFSFGCAFDGCGAKAPSSPHLPVWEGSVEVKNSARTLLPRFVALLVFWLIVDGAKPAGLVIGLPAAALGAWLAVKLMRPWKARISPLGVLKFCGHFLWGSLVAGVDLAIRALHPRLPLRTGFVACPCGISRGSKRDLFLAASSLMPGSLPVEEKGDELVVLHALDVEQSHAAQLAENELRFARATGAHSPDA